MRIMGRLVLDPVCPKCPKCLKFYAILPTDISLPTTLLSFRTFRTLRTKMNKSKNAHFCFLVYKRKYKTQITHNKKKTVNDEKQPQKPTKAIKNTKYINHPPHPLHIKGTKAFGDIK